MAMMVLAVDGVAPDLALWSAEPTLAACLRAAFASRRAWPKLIAGALPWRWRACRSREVQIAVATVTGFNLKASNFDQKDKPVGSGARPSTSLY
jgi:hypothetical protein